MQSVRLSPGLASLFLAIWGCSVASAADGSATTSTQTALAADATPPSRPVDEPPRHKPPQEAFDACKSLSEGAACSVNFNGHSMTGTCRKPPHGEGQLVCVPQRPPGPPPSDSNQTLTGSALERKLDQLEREIHGS